VNTGAAFGFNVRIVWPARRARFTDKGFHEGADPGGQNEPVAVTSGQPFGRGRNRGYRGGLTAYEQLLAKLADVLTPPGPTPRQLGRGARATAGA
jgi:hypothetical protein